jgi:hypothetical protein
MGGKRFDVLVRALLQRQLDPTQQPDHRSPALGRFAFRLLQKPAFSKKLADRPVLARAVEARLANGAGEVTR